MESDSNSSLKNFVFEDFRLFEDGFREVDFVLGYSDIDITSDHVDKRHVFQTNLAKEGLQLEEDISQCIHFIKIHAPMEVLYRYAEVLKIKMPMKRLPGQEHIYDDPYKTSISGEQMYFTKHDKLSNIWIRLFTPVFKLIRLNPKLFPRKKKLIFAEFQVHHQSLFETTHSSYFDAGTRNYIVYFILERTHFMVEEDTLDKLGIEELLNEGVYICAYTLHHECARSLLLREWGTCNRLLQNQPLDNIKEYFGAKIAIYFAWLGFYATMLIPLTVMGLLYLLFGILTLPFDDVSKEICADESEIIMCPSCDRDCDFWELKEICTASKINHLIDNFGTVIYAFVTSIWAVLFLELWKRYVAQLVHDWGLTDYTSELEHPRPQYLAKLRKDKKLAAKMDHFFEPDVPCYHKLIPMLTNYSVLMMFICISLMVAISIIVYRMAQRAANNVVGQNKEAAYVVFYFPMASTVIELTMITILASVYSNIAEILTNWEYCRTQKEFDDSLTTKRFVFNFVNYYSSLFYIAFIKGKFIGYPGKYNRYFGFRQEECHHGGCLLELSIQLIVIMSGKRLFFSCLEIMKQPLKIALGIGRRINADKLQPSNQWSMDYNLIPWCNSMLYMEYLEMVIQYGFITIFGLAFPLAPLLACINNTAEIRLDGFKYLSYIQRPTAQRDSNIGVWFGFLQMITKLAVMACAVLIAFSTNFITKIFYMNTVSKDGSLKNYTNFVLSRFETAKFEVPPILKNTSTYFGTEFCSYWDFRNPPEAKNAYERPMVYWQILVAKLIFVVLYQNVIILIQSIISWSITDVSRALQKRIERENYLLREFIIEYEKKLALNQDLQLE